MCLLRYWREIEGGGGGGVREGRGGGGEQGGGGREGRGRVNFQERV